MIRTFQDAYAKKGKRGMKRTEPKGSQKQVKKEQTVKKETKEKKYEMRDARFWSDSDEERYFNRRRKRKNRESDEEYKPEKKYGFCHSVDFFYFPCL